ncbi:E3 ubiquitin-protein ligase ubr2 [Phytophthora boehmeriae]|uniref:E3 ubiquitin-protein ligase n=1 Tax=Phytophthora boehmeriae TaxID=109152 RepID=A0A8T1X1G3_9STRA|nr:E3 ubiquitin-protein ligase ubr2 [Phytophthora boehmeriae]
MDLFARARGAIDRRGSSALTRGSSHSQEDAQEPAQDERQPQDRVLLGDGPTAKVRALLAEMQASTSWGEKEHEGEERRLLQELQNCVLDAQSREKLEKLPKRMCAYEFKPGDIAWNCKVCQVDETCVMCNDCFISSDHEDHEVFFYYTHSGGCCDCGDTEAWAPEGFCTRHKGAQDADPLTFLPPDLLVNSRDCIGEVMKLVLSSIKEARFGSVVNGDDLEVVRDKLGSEPPERRYSVIVHYNELQTSQEFATALNKAHPAIAYQMLKIVGETSSQKQSIVRAKASREDVLELAHSLYKHGIVTSIVPCEYKARVPLINSLLQWLASLANLSDGLCRLICEKMCAVQSLEHNDSTMDVDEADDYPMLRAVIMADSFLPKSKSDALHSMLMALLADPLFKQAFAISFTSSYRQLYREFAAGVGSSTATILAFSVQFFNRATFVKQLVAEYDLLEVLVNSVLETLRKKTKTSFIDIAFEDTWNSMANVLHPEHNQELDVWDIFAMGIQRSQGTTLRDVNVSALALEAERAGYRIRHQKEMSPFLSLPPETELTGRFELDVTSPVFVCRRYMSGLLDLRFQLLGVDWLMASIMERFDVEEWYEAAQSSDAKEAELMVTECLMLLSQLASELPPKVTEGDAMRSLVPYLRREIVQRLCVGPCAHSDLSKIANEFFLSRENLFPVNFSGGPILDQILKEVCVETGGSASGGGESSSAGAGKFQYRLKPELYAEYNPTFVHLTRKQHESAHENWFQHRLRSSKKREQEQVDGSPNNTHSTWLDYPMTPKVVSVSYHVQ